MKANDITDNIYESYDYSTFKLAKWNREIGKRAERVKESIQSIGYRNVPIVINKNREVIDGQARFIACKDLGLPIKYIIDESADRAVCIGLNVYQKNWQIKDYVRSYAETDDDNYLRLIAVQDKYPTFSFSTILNFAKGYVGAGNGVLAPVKEGRLVFTEDEYKRAMRCAEYVSSVISELKRVPGRTELTYTMVGWVSEVPDVSKKHLTTIIKNKYQNIIPSADSDASLKKLSKLYNAGWTGKRLYFDVLYAEQKLKKHEDFNTRRGDNLKGVSRKRGWES